MLIKKKKEIKQNRAAQTAALFHLNNRKGKTTYRIVISITVA